MSSILIYYNFRRLHMFQLLLLLLLTLNYTNCSSNPVSHPKFSRLTKLKKNPVYNYNTQIVRNFASLGNNPSLKITKKQRSQRRSEEKLESSIKTKPIPLPVPIPVPLPTANNNISTTMFTERPNSFNLHLYQYQHQFPKTGALSQVESDKGKIQFQASPLLSVGMESRASKSKSSRGVNSTEYSDIPADELNSESFFQMSGSQHTLYNSEAVFTNKGPEIMTRYPKIEDNLVNDNGGPQLLIKGTAGQSGKVNIVNGPNEQEGPKNYTSAVNRPNPLPTNRPLGSLISISPLNPGKVHPHLILMESVAKQPPPLIMPVPLPTYHQQNDLVAHPSHNYNHYENLQEQNDHSGLIEGDEKMIIIKKTLLGSKYLKKGTGLVLLTLVVMTFVLAGLATAGATLSPIVFPLVLLPVGIIALLLFIPLILIFVPFVISGLGGRRMDRSVSVVGPEVYMDLWGFGPDWDARIERDLDKILKQLSRKGI